MSENYITHVSLVLDASGSMMNHKQTVPTVADNLIQRLASKSQELDQETRVSIYVFNDNIRCLIFDKDVLRLPSIKGLYTPGGSTALLAAIKQAQDDLRQTATMYGDHAFLNYGLTDGQENHSRFFGVTASTMLAYLRSLKENETIAIFVPDSYGKAEARSFGFPEDNISIWNTGGDFGDVGEVIYTTTDTYMQARSTGLRGTTQLFNLTPSGLKAAVQQGALQALKPGQFNVLEVTQSFGNWAIKSFVEAETGRRYSLGEAYYELTKREEIQPQKDIAILDQKAYTVYHGKAARQMLGLPDNLSVRVSPQQLAGYTIFVQSTSVNRKLVPGTKVLLLS